MPDMQSRLMMAFLMAATLSYILYH